MHATITEAQTRISFCEFCPNLNTENNSCTGCGCPMVNVILSAAVPCPLGNFTSAIDDPSRHEEFLSPEATAEFDAFIARTNADPSML